MYVAQSPESCSPQAVILVGHVYRKRPMTGKYIEEGSDDSYLALLRHRTSPQYRQRPRMSALGVLSETALLPSPRRGIAASASLEENSKKSASRKTIRFRLGVCTHRVSDFARLVDWKRDAGQEDSLAASATKRERRRGKRAY